MPIHKQMTLMSRFFFSESIKYSVINAYSQTNDSYEQVLF